MNRRFFFIILMTVLFAAFITSCDREVDGYSSPTSFSGGISGVIEGECASWDYVGIYLDGGVSYDIVEITPIINGKFSFSSLPVPKPEHLKPFIDSEVLIDRADFQISDRNAKVCDMALVAIKGNIDASYESKSIVQGIYAYPAFVNTIMYYYADKDFTAKGSFSGTDTGINFSTEININLKRGWNTLRLIWSRSEEKWVTTLKNDVPPLGTVWTEIIIE